MNDFGRIDLAHLVLAFVAWVWALSQIKAAVQEVRGIRDPDETWLERVWRLATALWMTTKASYFTFVGTVWWFDRFVLREYEIAIYVLATVHVIAFVPWLLIRRRDSRMQSVPPPPQESLRLEGRP
jgi:hypothetical protein